MRLLRRGSRMDPQEGETSVKPTTVMDLENLHALERELKKSGCTVVYNTETRFTAYKDGKTVKIARVRGGA